MAINFPDSPNINDQFSVSGRTWIWNGVTWDSVSAGSTTFVASDTAPLNPKVGSGWFDTSTGQFFIYYDSGWVEFGTNVQGPKGDKGDNGADGVPGQPYGNIDGGKANTDYNGILAIVQGGSAGSF